MRVLLIGSGGREHALAWRLANSDRCEALFCAPGNAGICGVAECVNIDIKQHDQVVDFAKENQIDLVVVGPEDPLCAGIADSLIEHNIPVFGPTKDAAILEGSKAFTKDLCKKYNIPTAGYERFKDPDKAKAYIRTQNLPLVVKADGLAAGKGVIICQSYEEAEKAAEDMLSGSSFGEAGAEIVIEEFMDGEELSYFALSDGKTVVPLTSAQDHKRVGDGDTGLNTGGMGAYSPAHIMTSELESKIMDRIINPTIEGMQKEGRPFKGVLYAGLMIVGGEPKLIEYNVRFGDPECQAMMVRLKDDFLELLNACAHEKLHEFKKLEWSDYWALCVVMAAKGYPESYQKGTVIKGFEKVDNMEHIKIFHAGTALNDQDELVNTGGRVLNVVAAAEKFENAQKWAYEAIEKIDWPEGFYRKDIGWRAAKALKEKVA